jgi:predicted secreted acid phosphatase
MKQGTLMQEQRVFGTFNFIFPNPSYCTIQAPLTQTRHKNNLTHQPLRKSYDLILSLRITVVNLTSSV